MPTLSDDGARDRPGRKTPGHKTCRNLRRPGPAPDAEELRVVQVFTPATNVRRFAEDVDADVLS